MGRGRRRLAATAGVLVAASALTLGGAGAASAGGPTSVLIVSPESAETAALYNSDDEYGELSKLLGEPEGGTAVKPPSEMVVRRQDQVFLTEDGTPWVRTDPTVQVNDDDIRWNRAPRRVFGEAERAGLLGPADAEESETPIGWAIPGLAVGFVAGVGGTLLIRRAAGRQTAGPPRQEPRQELIDL